MTFVELDKPESVNYDSIEFLSEYLKSTSKVDKNQFQTVNKDYKEKYAKTDPHYEEYKKQELKEQIIASNWKNNVLVLVSMQLGMKNVPSEYFEAIHKCMNIKQCVGAVSGRPGFAYYFVGTMYSPAEQLMKKMEKKKAANSYVDTKMIYLDPHCVKSKVTNLEKEYKKKPQKFHCDHARILDMSELDPSISFGFLLKSFSDFKSLQDQLEKINSTIAQSSQILHVHDVGTEERMLRELDGVGKGSTFLMDRMMVESIVSIKSDYIRPTES